MISPGKIEQQINELIGYLVKVGLADSFNFPFTRRKSGQVTEISFVGSSYLSTALKENSNYLEIYDGLHSEGAYNVRLLDGALISMRYLYVDSSLKQHYLSFYPSPYLEEYQSDPEIYLDESNVFAEIVARNVVPFPIRFDFDCRENIFQPIIHPRSHLTLGQYKRCRIPVTAPLTPYRFISFILRNFYNTAFQDYADKMPSFSRTFQESIVAEEKTVIHVQVP
ncbi:MAG: DUF2290 domain-containing protein [Cyanobacteria bacterium P01_G01_bin.54]